MANPRKYATNAERQAEYRQRCRAATTTPQPPPAAAGKRRWKMTLNQACHLLDEVVSEMTLYQDERSERWQESVNGERFTERLEAIEEALANLQDQVEA